jgi:hypothetical protein
MSEQASLTEQPVLAGAAENGASSANGASAERAWVRDLADGQAIEGIFGVRERELRQRRNGGEWLRLIVCDRSGAVEAVAWDEVAECFDIATPGSAVHITGRFAVHSQYGPKITIETIRAARDGEFEPADLASSSARSRTRSSPRSSIGSSRPTLRSGSAFARLPRPSTTTRPTATVFLTTRSRSPRP